MLLSTKPDLPHNYDVIISHGPGCNDGSTAAWAIWRNLDKEYRDLLEKEGGFYFSSKEENNKELSFF